MLGIAPIKLQVIRVDFQSSLMSVSWNHIMPDGDRTNAKWSEPPPAPSERRSFTSAAVRRAALSTGSTQGFLHGCKGRNKVT